MEAITFFLNSINKNNCHHKFVLFLSYILVLFTYIEVLLSYDATFPLSVVDYRQKSLVQDSQVCDPINSIEKVTELHNWITYMFLDSSGKKPGS